MLAKNLSCFSWLVLKNRLWTYDNLQKVGFIGANVCILYKKREGISEPFIWDCHVFLVVLNNVTSYLGIFRTWNAGNFAKKLEHWMKINCTNTKKFPFLFAKLCGG